MRVSTPALGPIHLTFLAVSFLAVSFLAGCASPPDEPPPASGPVAGPPLVLHRSLVAGTSVEGRPLRYHVLGHGEETVLFIASIHGNEGLGTPLAEHLLDHLLAHSDPLRGRRVAILPMANPDGLAAGTRRNARAVDLNRNFPAANFRAGQNGPRPLSEPEAKAIERLLRELRPGRVVSIHQPLALIDYDGPGGALARAMAGKSRLEVRRLGGRPGSLGSYVGRDLGIPIVTVELPRHGGLVDPEDLWQRYGAMLLEAIEWTPPGAPQSAARPATSTRGSPW